MRRNKDKKQYDQVDQEETGIGRDPVVRCDKLKSLLTPHEQCRDLKSQIEENKAIRTQVKNETAGDGPEDPFNDFTPLYLQNNNAKAVRFKSDHSWASIALNELIKDCGTDS